VVQFPTSHAIATLGAEFLHARSNVNVVAIKSDLIRKQYVTRAELTHLSSQIVNLCQRLPSDQNVNSQESDMIWLYANALRISKFDQTEIAKLGNLASYRAA